MFVVLIVWVVGGAFWGTLTFLGARMDNRMTNGASIRTAIGSALFMAALWPLLIAIAAIGLMSLARPR